MGDYLDEFDDLITKMTEQLRKDANYWAGQEANQTNVKAKFPLKDLECFEDIGDVNINFR